MATLSLPLKRHEGKHYLAKRVIFLMPRHLRYVEPYAGGNAYGPAVTATGEKQD